MIYIIKTILFNSVIFFISFSLNTIIGKAIDSNYIQSFWSCLCIWILSESHIIITDLKISEYKYKNLYKDYKEKLLILDSINELKIKIMDMRKDFNSYNNSPIRSPDIINANSNSNKLCKIIETSPLNSCDISNLIIPKINKANSLNCIYNNFNSNKNKYLNIEMKGRLNSTLGNKSCIF